MPKGQIIRGIGGFYYIAPCSEPTAEIECKAPGRFRKIGLSPMVGDYVDYLVSPNGQAVIQDIDSRKSMLNRPPVSNIDRLFIVLSASVPEPDWLLADKLILEAFKNSIDPVLVLNKLDTAKDDIILQFRNDYSQYFLTVEVSAEKETNLDSLKSLISGHTCCFAGQSAVGKSSLMNALLSGKMFETDTVSRKTERGRHTTRRAEIKYVYGGAVADTPGFSLLENDVLMQEELNRLYPEFSNQTDQCRFPGCMHITEPGCVVKDLINRGLISKTRYERYTIIAKDYEYRRKHRYD